MRSRNLTNKDIDRLGTKMLKAVRVQKLDIDRIICADDLFEPVRQAMAARPTVAKNSLAIWTGFALLRWRTLPAFAAMTIAALGAFYLIRPTLTETGSYAAVPAVEFPVAVADIGSTDVAIIQVQTRPSVPVRKHIPKERPRAEVEDVGEFQALTYTDDASEAADGQILRVELPRSSLFAMGVDVPVENQTTKKVKADLLIGEDGIMRAVRIVN